MRRDAGSHQRFRIGLLGGVALALLTPARAALAQDGASSVSEIIVTAQRRAQRLEDVPMSVAAVTADTIQRSGVTSIHDLNQVAPGVRIDFAGTSSQPSIRGVSTLTTGGGYENNVAIYIDGFYAPDNISINTDLGANISDIQVLKGPQGALYGRNATGGAILINTAAPSKTFTADVQASYARFNEYTLGGYVSGPISDTVRYSLSAYRRDGDGYIKYIDPAGTGQRFGHAAPFRQESIRGKIEADLTSNLTATFALNYGLSSDPRGHMFTTYANFPANRPRPPFSASDPYTASLSFPAKVVGVVREGTAKLVWRTPIGTVSSYTGFAHRHNRYNSDVDGAYARISESQVSPQEDTFQQTVDYAITAIDKLDLIIGATYYDDDYHNPGSFSIVNGRVANVQFYNLYAKAWAIYADAAYSLTDRLTLNIGGRYTEEKKRFDWKQLDATLSTNLVTPGAASKSFSAFTPRATIRYELADRTNVYASWSKGFRTGGFQPFIPATPALATPFRPEKITAYEVGFKMARGMYRLDVAGYYYDYRDLQVGVTIFNPVSGTLLNQVSNAPKAEIYGLDIQGSITPIDSLTLTAGLALIHGRYKEFPNATGVGVNAATGLNVSQPQDWTGLQMARAPEVSATLAFDYHTALAGGVLTLSGNVSYTSDYPISNPSVYGPLSPGQTNIQRFKTGEFTLVNGQIAWTDPSDRYTVSVFGSNLLNETYYITSNGNTVTGTYRIAGQPRSYGVKVRYKY